MGIDSIVNTIQKNSSNSKELMALLHYLKKEEPSLSKTKSLSEPIAALDPAQHALGLSFLWEAKLKYEKNDAAQYISFFFESKLYIDWAFVFQKKKKK